MASYYFLFGKMSKIGQKPIIIPKDVSVTIEKSLIKISGPNGEKVIFLPNQLKISIHEDKLFVTRDNEEKKVKSLHGLYRQLIDNLIQGVIKPWEKRLEIIGTGYNARLQGEDLVLKLGYSHPVVFKKQEEVKYQVMGNNIIVVSGIDKQLVGQVAAQIKSLKKPDVYKGKGIRYFGEKIRLKPGKKAKGVGGIK